MKAYYILKTTRFDHSLSEYATLQQIPVIQVDEEPIIKFTKLEENDEFIKYSLYSESFVNKKGRAYTHKDVFKFFIEVKENYFYYYKTLNIAIFSCSKETFLQFVSKFKNNADFVFEQIDVNFDSIIENQHSLGIQGIWLGKIRDMNIKSLLMLGSQVQDSSKLQDILSAGAKITNITLIYKDSNNKQEMIMITKDGGIVIYPHLEENICLQLVKDAYFKLLT